MKRNSKKLLTLLLAGALCTATIGGVAAVASAEETATQGALYDLIGVFTSKGSDDKTKAQATVSSEKVNDGDEKATAKFSFKKKTESEDPTIEFSRDLALKWFEEKGAKYFNFTFAFADENCKEVSFEIQTSPYQAVSEEKAINTLKIVKDGGVKVYVNDEESKASVTVAGDVSVSLDAGSESGAFAVMVGETKVGEFTNIGANYAEEGSDKSSFLIRAVPVDAAEETAIYLKELNGQSFANNINEKGKVEDNAPAVLIVNQEISHFLMGTAFNLDYKAIDVLKSSITISTSDRKYYQYNPADTEIGSGKDISGTTYFMDTVYYTNGTDFSKEAKEGYTATSVWRECGEEYVSIWFTLNDGTYKDKKYELAWYAEDTVEKTVGKDTKKYIVINRNEDGPEYTKIALDNEKKCNVVDEDLETLVAKYNEKLAKTAKDKYAGSGETFNLPAVDWLINDNNGYKSLSFTISYKTPTSTSPSTASNKKYNNLQITTASEGWYEFKIFASDSANNAMKYYLDGELVEVTTSNVWEIEEIPTFKFKMENRGIKTKDDADKDTLDNKILNDSYTMSKVSIIGATNEKSAYKLYKINDHVWEISSGIAKKIAQVKYAALNERADELTKGLNLVDSDDYMVYYLQAFEDLLKKQLTEGELAKYNEIKASLGEGESIFTEINPYDSSLDEDEGHNIYNWSATSRRFTAAEEGLYLILADYWDDELPTIDRVPAYKLIEVSEEKDTIKGVSEWLKNNLVSVILLGVAAVLLIVFLILWFVKPSDETLEDVDKKAKDKEKNKK